MKTLNYVQRIEKPHRPPSTHTHRSPLPPTSLKATLGKRTTTTTKTTTTTTPTTTTIKRIYSLKLCHMMLLAASALLLRPTYADWLMECGNCHCKWNSGKKTADCKNLSLAAVPKNLSPEIQVLDLSNNHISHLEQNIFLRAQLHNLHKLYIRNAAVQKIDSRCFAQLEILIELDLSHNLLRSLQINQFAHLVKVRALILNNNLLESLDDGVFQNLHYLHRIEMKNNRLSRIAAKVFVNLPMLSQIYLDENHLSYLSKQTFENLKRLTALSLDQNPWNCTCDLQVFRDFVLERNLYTPPTACYHPQHLRGMLWIEDQPEAFACKPKILFPARGASINTSKDNVTLICRIQATANTHIAWNHNKQMIRLNTEFGVSQRIRVQVVRDESPVEGNDGAQRNVIVSRLIITGADKSDEGIYTCLAENAGGKDSVQMSLLIQNAGGENQWLSQGNLVIVICLLALGLLSFSFFLTMVTCCLYKRFKVYNGLTQHHQRHHNHHPHLDTQLTTTGNVIIGSAQMDSNAVGCSTATSAGLSGDNEKTTTVGGYSHFITENANAGNSRALKKYTKCLLQEDKYVVTNSSADNEKRKLEGESHLKYHAKDTSGYPNFHDVMTSERQGWSASYCNKNAKDDLASRKEGHVGDFKPDLLFPYNSQVSS